MMILNGSVGYKWSMLVVIVVIFDVMPTLHGCSSSNNPGSFKNEMREGDETNPTERAVTLAVIDARYLASLKNKFNYLHDRMRLSTTTIKSKLCNSMSEYHSMALINAINVERGKVGKHAIPASDDMCVTALLKGMVQKESNDESSCGFKSNLHDWSQSGVKTILSLKARVGMEFPVKLTPMCNYDKPGGWKKPNEILGRQLRGQNCYGCSGSSSGFENAHHGSIEGSGSCSHTDIKDVVTNAIQGWLDSPGDRATMFNQKDWAKYNWTRVGAAVITRCVNEGDMNETLQHWSNAWFSDLA